jgi:hypothetical protein
MSIDEPPPYAIVMKGGVHASEGWEEIVERKRGEERSAGVILWGYGGTVCHPMTQVQPFAEDAEGAVAVLMIRTPRPRRWCGPSSGLPRPCTIEELGTKG